MYPQKDWKTNLDRAHFFRVQCGRITVWSEIQKALKLFPNFEFFFLHSTDVPLKPTFGKDSRELWN